MTASSSRVLYEENSPVAKDEGDEMDIDEGAEEAARFLHA